MDTAEDSVCFFNCGVGSFSVGTLTCDPSTNQWVPSDGAICLPGNGSGVGDPEIVLPDGDCLGGTPENPSDYSANVIAGPNLFTLAISGSNFDPQVTHNISRLERSRCAPNLAFWHSHSLMALSACVATAGGFHRGHRARRLREPVMQSGLRTFYGLANARTLWARSYNHVDLSTERCVIQCVIADWCNLPCNAVGGYAPL